MPRPDRSAELRALDSNKGPSRTVLAAIVAVIALLAAAGAFAFSQKTSTDTTAGDKSLPAGALAGGAGINPYPNIAKSGVPTVDIYEDFQCAFCGQFEKSNGAQVAGLAELGQVKVTYHVMSFLDPLPKNDSSVQAANGAFCAADAGKGMFEAYHRATFDGQPQQEGTGFTKDQLKSFGSAAGITGKKLTTFKDCVDSGTYVKYAKATQTNAAKKGVTSTPTFFFNGKKLSDRTNEHASLVRTPGSFEGVLKKLTK